MIRQDPFIKAVNDTLPTYNEIPRNVIDLARSLYKKSQGSVSLRSNEEAGRAHICAILAVEQLRAKPGSELPKPITKRAPVQERALRNLLEIFRKNLLSTGTPTTSAPSTPKKQKPAPSTPTSKRISTPADAQYSFDQFREEQMATPTRKGHTPASGRKRFAAASPSSPSPSKKRKQNGPSQEDIIEKCEALHLDDSSVDAVAYGYRHYTSQIKDKWLFLSGLICTVTARAHPHFLKGYNGRTFQSIVADLLPVGFNEAQVKEWHETVDEMVGEHSWIKKITKESHTQKEVKRPESMLGVDTQDDWKEQMLKRIKA